MDELVYHLNTPLEGTNTSMIRGYVNSCIIPALLILCVVIVLFIQFRKRRKYYLVPATEAVLSLIISGIFIGYAWNTLNVGGYMNSQSSYSTFIDDNYVNPGKTEITFPDQKRNLIYIYLESMETTYADKKNGGGFEENCIPELTSLAQENEDFSGDDKKLNGGYAMPGATWTIAAMFAQTSGLPLNISIEDNSMDTQDSFFAGAVTLGDILEDAGYSQTLMIGSDAVFGGRQLYFTEHGNYDILDYNYAAENKMIPEGYRVWWGYEDELLFGFAKDKLMELSEEGGPFNLTMLTVDTHFEDGYVCDICPDTFGDNQYANVMACSSRQVADFISWIQKQSFYDNTTIVISGDHPTMDSDFCNDIDTDYTRKVYTTVINPAIECNNDTRRDYTTFDNFPTTLASLGAQIDGDRLGLGTNLFSDKPTLIERFGMDNAISQVSQKSKLLEDLANLDENNEELLLREKALEPQPAITASVSAGEYDFGTGLLPVTVTDIANANDGIASVTIEVQVNDDPESIQWVQLNLQPDGSYSGDIDVPSFGYKTGIYHIGAYVVDNLGAQVKAGETAGTVN